MRCSKCDIDNREGRKFCASCGAPLAIACAKCGASNLSNEQFCGECGAPLETLRGASKRSRNSQYLIAAIPAPEEIEGERKIVTALFADIRGSTELIEDLDPEEARALIDPALKLMIDAARRYDGHVVRSTGDGVFALFGAPVAHEDHPQRALYAALRIQEELARYSAKLLSAGGSPIQSRIGIHSGEVVMRLIHTGGGQVEYDAIGHTANLAARMQVVAPVGSIAATGEVRKLCEGYFLFKGLGPTRMKGVSEPVEVNEVTGLGPLRTRLHRAAGRGLTRFVGREREMAVLKLAAEQAAAGRGQIATVMAEPGVGKSRLCFEFKVTSQGGWMVLETFSVSHGKASAYMPVIDLLRNYFRIAVDDDERTRREKVAGKIAMLDRSLEDTLPYLFSLLGIIEGNDPMAQMDAQVKKRRTMEAIKRILLRESLNQPLMVIFEDLHWIDEATQDLLNLLADSIGTAKILLLVNYRPEYSHQWGSKTYYTQLRLDPLGKESAGEMLAALLGDAENLAPLKRLIIERTEGTPFFMEEMVQALFEDRVLIRNGVVKLARPISTVKPPTTVQAVLAARMDRLAAEEKELLQTLAVLGREFPLGLVQRVATRTDEELSQTLARLQVAEFIYEQPAVGDTEYIFKHALTQEVAYNSVLIERRTQLHERIGRTLEALYTNSLDDHLNELAHHYGRANNPDKAVHYLTLAGKQAAERSAFSEAQGRFQSAVDSINALPESPERDTREMELATALARVLLITKGFAAPETREAAERARVLAEKGGNLAQLVLRVYDVWRPVMVSGDYLTAGALADRILYLARRDASLTSLALAYNAKEAVCFFRGDLVGVEEYFALQSGLFEDAGFRQSPASIVIAMGNASRCAWVLGYAEKARARLAQLISFAEDSKNPFELAFGLGWEGFLTCHTREPRHTEVAAIRISAISEERDFPFSGNQARILMGWARAQLGSPVEGIALIHQGLTAMTDSGTRIGITDYLTLLAEAQALNGENDQAVATIEEALQANPEELVFRPNILNYRGELRRKLGQTELAEVDFREAVALAAEMRAKAWELRATTNLARLLASQDRRGEARAMLAEIYNWFTEGFDTPDLKDAKALLDGLSS